MNYPIILGFAVLSCFSCKKEIDAPATTTEQSISETHPDLAPYLSEFELQANARGLSYESELAALITQFSDIPESGVAGQCSWSSHFPNTVTIDTPFWNSATPTLREYVVFHELGHCILSRGHDESQTNSGTCLSIMASGTESCSSAYTTDNRTYYLNELFLGDGT